MGAAGQRLGLRLFLEGLEVPVIGAQVQIGINAPATASIQVVPGDKIVELKARTMVHLFFWDYTMDQGPTQVPPDPQRVAEEYGVTVDEAKEIIAANPSAYDSAEQDELWGYKLLFSGEVIGVTIMKTPAGRQAVLQCSDFSTYWDTTYQFFVSYSPGGNFLGTSAAVWAGSDSLFDDLTAGHTSVMNEYLRSKPKTPGLQNVKGLMGGIISLLEAMGGVPNHTHGINDFFTIAELKNHILQQIVAEQNDDTAQRLFDDKAFNDWLSRGMSSMGQLTTFRDMMKLLFQYVYYEVVPNPAAMYVQAKQSKTNEKRVSLTTRVMIPAEILVHIIDIEGATFPYLDLLYMDVTNADEDKRAKSIKKRIQDVATAKGMPAVYRNKLEKAYTWLDQIKSTVGDNRHVTEVGSSPLGDGPTTIDPYPSDKYLNNRKCWKKVSEIVRDVLGQDSRFNSVRSVKTKKAAELDRLHTQIFRPDCFFAAPPRCNVIFPEMYTQFQFSKNFLQETTRLRLSVDWLFGGDSGGLLAEYHFAPSTKDIAEIAKKQGNAGIRALLPWEMYSGILPKFESIHEVNYVAGQAERRRGIKGNIKGAATNYAQRTANFNYLKYRFASRQCEVSGKFNPFLVCGFPGVIIERPFILDPVKAVEIREKVMAENPNQRLDDMGEMVKTAAQDLGAPTQYLGMIAGVSHSVQQDSGTTSFSMTHARTHRITDDDFLGILSTEISKDLEKSIVSTVLDAEELFKKGDYRLLKFLMDATPQNLEKQVQADAEQQEELGDDDNSPALETRPSGAPDLDQVSQLAKFGILLAPPEIERPTKVSVPSTTSRGTSSVPIRGRVKKDRLVRSRDVILVPDPGGKLNPGTNAKGPKGGKIVQIQCVTDAAVGVVGKDTARRLTGNKNITLTSSPGDSFTRDLSTGKLVLQGNVVDSSQVTYFWKKIVIHEEVKTTKKATKILPIEEGIRPPWFSPLYSNWFIGNEIYEPFFGCGSIVDQAIFSVGDQAAAFGTGRTEQQEMLDKLKSAGNDRAKISEILEESKAKNITDVPDIESSVDVLAYIYGEVRRLGLDVHRFVHDYTRRPIATLEEIFGSADLQYKVDGTGDNKVLVKDQGTPGFHSSAIANYGELLGLLDNPDLELSRLRKGGGKKVPVSRSLDPRPGRRAKVVEYLQEINASSGSLGVGVEG